jgi:hypothetical protein
MVKEGKILIKAIPNKNSDKGFYYIVETVDNKLDILNLDSLDYYLDKVLGFNLNFSALKIYSLLDVFGYCILNIDQQCIDFTTKVS